MPYYAVVVADAARAHEQEIHRNIEHNVQQHGEASRRRVEQLIRSRYHTPRADGTLHCHGERGCPDGEAWCDHCGDPAYVTACLAQGHCPRCVTLQHGAIAHPAVLAQHGYALVEIDPGLVEMHPTGERRLKAGYTWDHTTRRFAEIT